MSRTSTVMAHNYSPSLNGRVHQRMSERSSMASSNSDGPTSTTTTTRQDHDQEHGYESAEEWPEPPLPEVGGCNLVPRPSTPPVFIACSMQKRLQVIKKLEVYM